MKTKSPRNPWRTIAIIFICLFAAAMAVIVLFSGTSIVWQVVNWWEMRQVGEEDRLEWNSWGHINQDIVKPEGWKQIVKDSKFQLGEIEITYGEEFWDTSYRQADATYPTIDGSTVMVPMAVEFARQHLNLSEEMNKRFASFSTTNSAYWRLFTREEGYYENTLVTGVDDWLQPCMTGRPLDLFIGTAPGPLEYEYARNNAVEPVEVPICRDAFVFITHKDNPVDSLTMEQIRSIYSGAVTNWKEVGGRDEAIRAFQREPGSGSQTGMEDLVMQGLPMADPEKVKIIEGMGGLIEAVAEYQNTTASIGYTYRYYIDNLYRNDQIKTIAVDGVAPIDGNIIDESYPLGMCYYGVIRKGDEEMPGGLFLDWILSEEGQACVKQAGYIPIGVRD